MKTLNVQYWEEIPKNFTGIAIYPNGSKFWYIDGKHSRLDGPAYEDADGNKVWYIDDKCSRLDGPAVEYANGNKFWYIDGKKSRLDGPAIEWSDGDKEWWIVGEQLTFKQFWHRMKSSR